MKQSIFDKIRSYVLGKIGQVCNHTFSCCNKITKNCTKCPYLTDSDNYYWDGTEFKKRR